MAALGALMVVAAIASINLRDVVSIMRTNLTAAAGFAVTLLASLLFSVPVAVFTGVALAIVMNLVRSSRSVTVRELTATRRTNWSNQTHPRCCRPGRSRCSTSTATSSSPGRRR